MENPDAEMELERDEHGNVTKLSYKIHNPGEEGRRELAFCGLSDTLLRTEGPGDTNVNVNANVTLG